MLFYKLVVRTAAGSSNGRIHDSGSCYLGSNPSPAAVRIIIVKFKSLGSPPKDGLASGEES